MRHGNKWETTYSVVKLIISILPMRHGNNSEGKILVVMPPHFDPTYEAWKPLLFLYFPEFIGKISILPMRHGNEIIFRGFPSVSRISILPMRHGNDCISDLSWTWSSFRSYLWGMETKTEERGRTWAEKFRSYLWGMETKKRPREIKAGRSNFDPTYEAWKPL